MKREINRSPFVRLGLNPDPAAMPVDNPMNDGQPNAGTFVLVSGMQSLKRRKKFVDILHIKAHSIVLDKIDKFPFLFLAPDLNNRGFSFTRELEGIGDQVEIDLFQ